MKQPEKEPSTPVKPTFDDSIPYNILGHGKLVFERIGPVDNAYNGVCVVDMDQQRKWEISGEIMNDPAVSPDGNNIAYTNLYSDSTWYDVFIMNIDGTNQRDITKMVGQESCPSWTFDGTQILFTNFGTTEEASYSQSPEPKPSDRVKVIDYYAIDPPNIYPPRGLVSSSLNGELVVYADGIRTFHSNGSGMQLIIPYDQNSDHLIYSPSWSPDGSKIAVLSYKMNSDIAVVLFDPNGTNADTVVSLSATGNGAWVGQDNEFSLCWSPDGTQIAFTRPDGPQDGGVGSHIYVIKTDHTSLRQVTFSPGVTDMSLSWSN
jgi:Tol biopolymer transport system component